MGSPVCWLCLIVAAGCGRVAFDARTDASTVDGACTEWGPFSTPIKLSEPPNTPDLADWHPWITANGLSLYMHQVSFTVQADIVKAARSATDQPFGAATVVSEVSSPMRDADPTLTADERVIVFATLPQTSSTHDLMIATRSDASVPFSPPVSLSQLNSAGDEANPSLTADGRELFFVLNTGPTAVMHTVRADVAQPFPPATVVPEVSVAGSRDIHVAISPDALELYLSSDRPGGLGRHDVWVSRRPAREAPFAPAVHVPEVSSATGDDSLDSLSADGRTAYLNYNADIGALSDVYIATRACR